MTGIEKLRKLSEDMIHRRLWVVLSVGTEEDWCCYQGDGRTVNDELLSIADQIGRESDVDSEGLYEENEELRDMLNQVAWRLGLGDEVHYYADNYLACQLRVLNAIEGLTEREQKSIGLFDARVGEEIDVCELFGIEPGDDPLTALRRHIENQDDTIENLCIELGDCSVAAEWVREHGGLDEVRRRWKRLSYYADLVPRSCMERRLARLQRQIDESHAALRRRNQRIALLASEINRAHNENRMEFMRRAGNYTAFADEVCKRLAPQLRYVEGCTKDVMDAALEALDRRLMPEGCDWEFLKLHMSNLRGFMLDVMDRLGVDKSDSDAPEIAFDALDRRLMPEGCEWPRYEDGESVMFWGFAADAFGTALDEPISSVELFENGFTLNGDGVKAFYGYEDRVRRPAHSVPASDGEPLEVGQTVWDVESGEELVIGAIEDGGHTVTCRYVDVGDSIPTHGMWSPSDLTHQRPVLDAGGVPIRKVDAGGVPIRRGDTVYLLPGEWCDRFPCVGFHGGEELEVFTDEEPHHVSGGVQCREKGKKIGFRGYCYPQPSQLTHTKPEPPDSWERLEEDARKHRYGYWECESFRCCACPAVVDGKNPQERYGVDDCQDAMQCDLVRRAKALAERDR